MRVLSEFSFISLVFFGILTIVGLVRPYLVLFWNNTQDRATVVKVFGLITIAFVVVWSISSSVHYERERAEVKAAARAR